jgi:hypothetical protein
MSRHSPFVIELTDDERRQLESLVRRGTAEHRMVIRAQIVLAAADGEENLSIARCLGVAPHTVIKWRKRFFDEGVDGLARLPERYDVPRRHLRPSMRWIGSLTPRSPSCPPPVRATTPLAPPSPPPPCSPSGPQRRPPIATALSGSRSEKERRFERWPTRPA